MLKAALFETNFPDLPAPTRGKVRDIYEAGRDQLVIVATDRISAFDVVMPNPIPGKGAILNRMSAFWFEKTRDIIANHLLSLDCRDYPPEFGKYASELAGRSMLVKRTRPLPVECVVRGYLSGSGWKDYGREGQVSGIALPFGLRESAKLPEPIFTPSSKALPGQHDQAINFAQVEDLVGRELARQLRDKSLAIYEFAAQYAFSRGIIIADCKFEFGLRNGELILIDELLTPDSSRFWPRNKYEEGRAQESFDKQFLRDYLIAIKWDQKPPAPILPEEIIEKTRLRYEEAFGLLIS